MNCPRCGSNRTSRALRKEGKGKNAKVSNLMEEWCDDCGWYGNHKVEPVNVPHDAGRDQTKVPVDRQD